MAFVVQKWTNGPYLSSSPCVRITCISSDGQWVRGSFFLANSSQSSLVVLQRGEGDWIRGGRPSLKYGGRSPKFIWAQCHVMCTAVLIGWDPATPPFPPHCDSYTRALLVSKDRRHLSVTAWGRPKAMRRSRDLRLYLSAKTHKNTDSVCAFLDRQTD
jgi:hypothetical protein